MSVDFVLIARPRGRGHQSPKEFEAPQVRQNLCRPGGPLAEPRYADPRPNGRGY
jgi:hypothetical protein